VIARLDVRAPCARPSLLLASPRYLLAAIALGEMLSKTALPDDSFAVLPAHLSDAAAFSADDRISLLSFTGSAKVGWHLKSSAGKKRVVRMMSIECVASVDVDGSW